MIMKNAGLLAMFSDNDGHVSVPETWAQIHRYCLKIYPKMCLQTKVMML